ncbi:glycosyltransferase family 4 protein [Acidianus manzaensis]|uniref:Glycosyl transferase family 1 n=1 Tax=Acidianus manzaensis TaxID=282676 RepID=A0A1W6K0S4_9CREN|nr:glycosyltransferase family 4 protein [Acidianus manzaensis]ARM76119.1 glycosyl transferase family 1 [Acidianus manzaensis]
MKISFVLISTGLTGGVRYIFEVANGLKNKGHDVKILSLAGDHSWFKGLKVEVIYKEPKFNKINNILYKLFQLYAYLRYDSNIKIKPYDFLLSSALRLGIKSDVIYELAEFIQNFSSDVMVATYYLTAFSVLLSNNYSKPFYLMQDFPELVESNEGTIELKRFLLSLKLPFSFVAVSNYLRQLILDNNPSAKVVVAHPGVDLNIFRPRKKHYENDKKKKVMIILRGDKYKGDEITIKTLNDINKKIPVHAIIVGRKKLINSYLKTIGINFKFSSFFNVDDETLAKLYSTSDAFLYTSYAEGFGLPPLEAMACGTPVVMTDNKGSRDYAINGYNALIADAGDTKTLVDYLAKVLQDDKLREKLIENGLETAKKFTWSSTVDRFEKVLREDF